ncbi:MAG: hypothetical protein E5V90_34525, partial [Mesorhizobium sp.]
MPDRKPRTLSRSRIGCRLSPWRPAFSGMLNVLMLAGSLYMLEVYDRVLPSRSLPTLVGISILLVILYCGQAFLDF